MKIPIIRFEKLPSFLNLTLLLAVCLAGSPSLFAKSTGIGAEDNVASIDQLVLVSKLQPTFENFSIATRQSIATEAQNLSAKNISESGRNHLLSLNAMADTLLAPEAFRAQVVSRLHSSLTQSDVKVLVSWYQSELGSKVKALESDFRYADHEDVDHFFQSLQTNPVSQGRLNQYRRLNTLSGSDRLLAMALGSGRQYFVMGMSSTVQDESRYLLDRHTQEVNDEIVRQSNQLQNYLFSVVQYVFRSLSISELNAYVAHLNTTSSRKFVLSINDGLNHAIKQGGYTLGGSVGGQLYAVVKD
ncbi:MAG: DUF2059 domain-containing protein [Granulosicoccus sp.]